MILRQDEIDILERALEERQEKDIDENTDSAPSGIFLMVKQEGIPTNHEIVSVPLDDALIKLIEPYQKPVLCVGVLERSRYSPTDLLLRLSMSVKGAYANQYLRYDLSVSAKHLNLNNPPLEGKPGILLRGVIPDFPSAHEPSIGRSPLPTTPDIATEKKNQIAKKYNVNVELLDTDQEFYAESTLQKCVKDDTYFISKESPGLTAQLTEYLLDYLQLKHKSLIELANAKRFEKADSTSTQLAQKIEEIKQTYRQSHPGKEPSLNKTAELLNEYNQSNQGKILPPQGGEKWYAQTIKRVLERTKIVR